jgi:hypothetical protein
MSKIKKSVSKVEQKKTTNNRKCEQMGASAGAGRAPAETRKLPY